MPLPTEVPHRQQVDPGKPAAAIIPCAPSGTGKLLKELHDTLTKLPGLSNDNETFARDVADMLRFQPSVPEKPVWE
jgi:hypothetical protein